MKATDAGRREFLAKVAQGAAVAGTGGLVWSYLITQQAKAEPFAIRPPGALPEKDYHAKCIKCGQCVQACPYDTLKLASAGDSIPIGTPYYKPRDVPCYMCPDIPCKVACPTGALDPGLTDINKARMGLAVIDIENCLSWRGLRCEACYRVCPVKNTAITVEVQQRKMSKHAMFVPVVHSDACTGCGMCEKACPTEKAAIRIVDPVLVQGKIGSHYRLGWTVETPITQEYKPAEKAAPLPEAPKKRGKTQAPASGLDYLNKGGGL